jgi:hypothetical protein
VKSLQGSEGQTGERRGACEESTNGKKDKEGVGERRGVGEEFKNGKKDKEGEGEQELDRKKRGK